MHGPSTVAHLLFPMLWVGTLVVAQFWTIKKLSPPYQFDSGLAQSGGAALNRGARLVLRKNSMDDIDPSFECSAFAVCTLGFHSSGAPRPLRLDSGEIDVFKWRGVSGHRPVPRLSERKSCRLSRRLARPIPDEPFPSSIWHAIAPSDCRLT